MDNLPNGFTGFADLPDDFESAGEASRRSRGLMAESKRTALGAHGRVRDTVLSDEPGEEIPFDMDKVDAIPERERRWSWVQVDLSAIHHNVAEARHFLNPRCRMLAVVGADAYGHGALKVAQTAIRAGVERLGVFTVSEAVDLRKAGITAPILLLEQPPAAGIPLLLAYGITPSIYDTSFAVSYGEMADMHGMKAPYHLVVNTGMNRLGVHFEQALEFLRQVSFHRALELEGVFTQFASAECSEPLDLRIQAKRFVECVGQIQSAGIEPGIVHAANSAAALRYPDVQFDMVRLGTALYGCHPCPETREFANLRPVMSVHARIVDTHVPPMSEGVSYGWNYRSPGSVKICTIPLGYADGLRRNLSGQIDFVMAGRYHRQVGEICMGHTMFEVDMRRYGKRERLDPKVGDEVVVIGSQGIAELTVDEMAEKLGTIPYEVLVGFGSRLNRAYS